jgi:hypothetical protein
MSGSKPFSQLLNPVSANDIIREIKPVVIPRISAVSHIAMCERAAYNIDFLGMQSGDCSASGEIGSAVHRIIIKSILEIVDNVRKAKDAIISKADAIELFRGNAIEDVNINWKRFVLAGVEKPLPVIMEDLDARAERVANQLLSPIIKKKGRIIEDQKQRFNTIIFRPEFTIRNIQIPLEGRLDLVKIRLAGSHYTESPDRKTRYLPSDELAQANIQDVEIIQIKTGKARPRNSRWNLQADAETLLLMKALNLKIPPKYIYSRQQVILSSIFIRIHNIATDFVGFRLL